MRNEQGHMAHYPVSEMVFNEKANLVEYVLAPARIDKKQEKKILKIAYQLVDEWDYVGILAIELFLNKDGNIWINEIAPRTHNSGHWTIEACHSSQFDQQIRLMTGLPFGSTQMKVPYTAMINLLGDPTSNKGEPHFHHIEDAYRLNGAQVHLYGKEEVRPYRKMGHITLVDDNIETLLQNAANLFSTIKINNHE
jgi:5-(carboxyamino)imidazole ribonucleotide synthase